MHPVGKSIDVVGPEALAIDKEPDGQSIVVIPPDDDTDKSTVAPVPLTGLKVTEADEKLILSMTLELNRENIRDKTEWLMAKYNPITRMRSSLSNHV